jgi:nitroreductase
MSFLDLSRKRRSIRKYRPDPVPEDKLQYVLEAARTAPSWANRQCWRYIVVTDEALRKKITQRDWAAEAPVLIVACADPVLSGNKFGQPYYMLDVGSSVDQLMLAAAEQGLGTCWIGGQFDEKTVKDALGVPDQIRVVALTPLGYPAEEKGPVTERKPPSEIVHRDRW